MNKEEMLSLRRDHAKTKNRRQWSINMLPQSNKEYSKRKDKDGLTVEQRKRVEAEKDRITYGDDDLSEVWD